MHQRLAVPSATLCAALAMTSANLLAADIEVIFTKIPGHPTSVIPGAKDLNGNPAFGEFRSFNLLIGSPDGSHWMMTARSQQGSDLETLLLIGQGNDGSVFAQEGQPVHDGEPGELYDFFGSGAGRFNDNNDFAFSARARNGNFNTKQKVIRVINGVAELVTQESDPYVGLLDVPGNPSGDELVGNSIGSIHLLNDGTVGAHDGSIKNIHTSRRPALFYNNIAFHQTDVTELIGMDGSTLFTWDTITSNTFYTTPSTSPISLGEKNDRWIAHGRRSGQSLSDRCFVVDRHIILETGEPLPGAQNIVSSITDSNLLSNGDWFVRGASDAGTRVWAMRNGEVFALTSDPISGTDERWANSFSQFTGNTVGDWVLIGKTDIVDNTADEVIVVNDQVVVREGDPVDLDGNGQFDDNVFIGRANPDAAAFPGQAFLSNDGYLYFFANIVDGDGNEYNTDPPFSAPTAFFRLDISPSTPCVGDLNGDSVVDVADLLALLAAWGPCPDGGTCDADLNNDGAVDVADMLMLLGAWGDC